MSLPADIYSEITDSITVVGEQQGEAGARKSPRVHLRTHVTLLPWNNPAAALSVRIRDLSSDGLGILHSQRLSLDEQFVIVFPRGEKTVLALYTIMYWEPLAENLYAIGAHFQRLVEKDELDARQISIAEIPTETAAVRMATSLTRQRKAS